VTGQQTFDAIVVGSGAAGGWAAKELTEQGLTVLLLEAGRTITPEVDFPVPARAERRLMSRIIGGLAGQQIQMRCPAFNGRTRWFFVNDRANPYTTPAGQPFNWFRGRQVGGRLHTWARLAVRISDREFKGASHDGAGVDWPLAYADLAPYYDAVETFLGVYGSADGIPSVPDGRYVGPFAMSRQELDFKRAVESAFPDRRVIGARVVTHDLGRVPRTVRAAQDTGRLTLRSDAVVHRIAVESATGRATGVSFVDRNTRTRAEARANVVVLCASTIETLRILFNSACPQHPAGLGNSSGLLGHYVMDHVLVGIGGPVPHYEPQCAERAVDPYDFGRASGFYIPRFRNTAQPHPDFRRGYAVQGGIGRSPYWYFMAHGEMLPRLENRVCIDTCVTDAWSIPVARISCRQSSNETAMIADALRTMREMADVAGLRIRIPPSGKLMEAAAIRAWRGRLFSRSGAFLPGSAIHEMGGARMGDDPRTSVLNRFGQCWDARNVFVTDGACFPSGCSQNITLTIMALTARTCDYLVQEYRAGRL